MKHVFKCRRTFVAVLGIVCLTLLGLVNNLDVGVAVAGCVAAICGANAAEASMKHKHSPKVDNPDGL